MKLSLSLIIFAILCLKFVDFANAQFNIFNPININNNNINNNNNNNNNNFNLTETVVDILGGCKNVYFYFIGNNLRDFRNTTKTTDFNSLRPPYFDRSRPTVFYTGGWYSNFSTIDAEIIFNAYISARRSSFNLVYIDWFEYNKDLYFIPMIQKLDCAAQEAAYVITKMRLDTWIDPGTFHFIGFSFGAHFMAHVARKLTLPPVRRITGLDPGAALQFTNLLFARYNFRVLFWTDANLVDVIHTSGGSFGYMRDLGHIDFYVNGGQKQKGCSLLNSLRSFKKNQDMAHIYLLFCNHIRSVQYYAESVRRPATEPLPFLSARCGLVFTYNRNTCTNTADRVSMGFHARNPPGILLNFSKRFFVETTDNPARFSLT